MKKILLVAIGLAFTGLAQAQTQDSVKSKTKTKVISIGKDDDVNITIKTKENNDTTKVVVEEEKKMTKFPKVTFGLTFEHFDIGFAKYHNGSDFGAPAGYGYLETNGGKTSNVGFDFFQMGIRFNSNFKIAVGAGIDWNHMRLTEDVTILAKQPTLTIDPTPSTVEFEKNRLSSRYLRVPLYFEYRSPSAKNGKRISVVAGPEVGFLMNGKLKQKSSENGKVKVKDDFNFEPFRYGGSFRLGYGGAGLFFKYYMNDVFAKNEGPKDYKNLNFGLTFGF